MKLYLVFTGVIASIDLSLSMELFAISLPRYPRDRIRRMKLAANLFHGELSQGSETDFVLEHSRTDQVCQEAKSSQV